MHTLRCIAWMTGSVVCSALANADVIRIGSFGSAATAPAVVDNSAVTYGPGGATYNLGYAGRTWAAPLENSNWVSFDAGSYPGGPDAPANGTYIYQTTFTILQATDPSGILSVMADDAADVLLNGHALTSTTGKAPGLSYAAAYLLQAAYLQVGLNTLVFRVQQVHGGATGLDFSGSVSTTPEPGSVFLFATGLLALAMVVRRGRSHEALT